MVCYIVGGILGEIGLFGVRENVEEFGFCLVLDYSNILYFYCFIYFFKIFLYVFFFGFIILLREREDRYYVCFRGRKLICLGLFIYLFVKCCLYVGI